MDEDGMMMMMSFEEEEDKMKLKPLSIVSSIGLFVSVELEKQKS